MFFINRLCFSVTCEPGMLFSIHSIIRSEWKNNAHYMFQLVHAAVDQYVGISKLQHHATNCHYYKNILCEMKCVEKSRTFNPLTPNDL
jgi:ribosomal protein L32